MFSVKAHVLYTKVEEKDGRDTLKKLGGKEFSCIFCLIKQKYIVIFFYRILNREIRECGLFKEGQSSLIG